MNLVFYTRILLLTVLAASLGNIAFAETDQQTLKSSTATTLEIYKTPQCGCCADWVSHMREAGFQAHVSETTALDAIKNRFGIQPALQSCHTADDPATNYVFEGHIPAPVIQRFIEEKPEGARGLAVPGMPVGSHGMEMGDRRDSYNVWMMMEDGSSQVYTRIKGNDQ